MKKYHIAVVGATGSVGGELLRVLERRSFPSASLRPIAPARSAWKSIRFRDDSIAVEGLTEHSFDKIDIAFFSAGGEKSRRWGSLSRAAGALVIENFPGFLMGPHVPRSLSR